MGKALVIEEEFQYAKEEKKANPDRCRKCHSAIWTVICRTGFRVRLQPKAMAPSEILEAYVSRKRIYITWKTDRGFEVEVAKSYHLLAYDGSRPLLGVHQCQPNVIHTEVVDPYTLAQVTIAITQSTMTEMELPF